MKRITVKSDIIITVPDGADQEKIDNLILVVETALNTQYFKALKEDTNFSDAHGKIGGIGLRFHFMKIEGQKEEDDKDVKKN